jgi:hypothetical protein
MASTTSARTAVGSSAFFSAVASSLASEDSSTLSVPLAAGRSVAVFVTNRSASFRAASVPLVASVSCVRRFPSIFMALLQAVAA